MTALILSIISWTIAAPFLLISAYLCLELACGLRRLPQALQQAGTAPSLAYLIPAHDEEKGIAATVAALGQTAPNERIIVIADNCSDKTAELARGAGAEVYERFDTILRGKGYALAFAQEKLAPDHPAVVIVIDADCRLSPGGGQALARAVLRNQGPVQCANLIVSPPAAAPLQRISNFAMLVKNLVRARGLRRLGQSIPLFGTGMAFPWDLFAQLPLASGNKVEDIELGIRLAHQGVRVELEDRVRVTSPAASVAASRDQRRRWEHGFLQMATRHAFPMIAAGILQRSRQLLTLGLHMAVPPIALYFLLGLLGLVLVAACHFLGASSGPVAALASALGSVLVLLGIAWALHGREVIGLSDLLRAPLYILWKIPLYLAFLVDRQSTWNRTLRDE